MATNLNWPLTVTQFAFNSGFSTAGSPAWADLSTRQWSMSCERGRQYELDQTQAGTAAIVLADKDEYLNPTNTGSPFSPNVLPYRQIVAQAMWPPLPVGGAVNLLNLLGQTTAYDMTFESYAVGSRPSWVLTFGGVSPVVTTTTPFQGSQCLTWTVTNGGGLQGVCLNMALIPGQVYTASAYVRQAVANQTDLWINGHAVTASTTTTGSYVRLAMTFVADQPTLQLCIASSTPTLTGAVLVDAIQLEPVQALNATPTFTGGIGAWAGVNNATLSSAATSQVGTASLKVTPDGVTAVPTARSEEVAVSAGLTYALYGVLQSTSTATRTLNIAWFNSSHTLLSSGTISQSATAGTWTVYGWQQYVAPAGAAFARVTTTDPGTPAAGNPWYVDQAFIAAVAPSTFSVTGPVIYGVHRGYVERWPSSWLYRGMYGKAEITTVDAFAALAVRKLHTEYRNSVMAKSPTYYWPLQEASGATLFGEQSGNGGPSLYRWDAVEGPATTYAAATASNVPGDPNGVGVSVLGQVFGGAGTIVHTGYSVGLPIAFGTSGTTWGITLSTWMSSVDPLNALTNNVLTVSNLATGTEFFVNVGDTAVQGSFNMAYNGGFFGTPNLSKFLHDGVPHLVMGTFAVAANSYTMNFYVDGILSATTTGNATASFGSPSVNGLLTSMSLLGEPSLQASVVGSMQAGMNGLVTQASLWNRALSSTEVADLYAAGQGYPGETSGARVTRYLSYGFAGTTSIDAGQSTMGVSNLADRTGLLDACQAVTTTESGNFWAAGPGTLTFAGRNRRYLITVGQWTIGENPGELPYEEDIAYDYDATLVYNDIQVANTGGSTVPASDVTSQNNYGPRSYQRTVNVLSNLEPVDAANWILATHKDPHQRIATLTLKPSANPALWPVALGAEIGQRVTVKRYTLAGYTMIADFFVEQINHDQKPGEWTTSFQMSPVGLQPWILEDAIYGQLDVTTVLGY